MNIPLTSDQLDQLYTAFCAAQAEMPMIELNKEVKTRTFSYKYADLTEVVRKTRGCLTKHGLSVSQMFFQEEGILFIVTRLQHISGQWQQSLVAVTPDENTNQSRGKAITYAKRYAYAAIVGVVADEDEDCPPTVSPSTNGTYTSTTISKDELKILEQDLSVTGGDELKKVIINNFKIKDLSALPKVVYSDVRSFIQRSKTG